VNFNTFDLNLLIVLDALLSERSVTRAAAKLHMTQPATSAALARLRKQLGDAILVRDGRSLRPTPYAVALEAPIRDVLANLELALNANPEFDPAKDQRTFRIAASDYAAVILLRPLLALLQETAPGVRLNVVGVTRSAPHQLIRDEIDLAVIPREVIDLPPLVEATALFTDEYVCAVWRGNDSVGDMLTADEFRSLPGLGYAHYSSIDFAEGEIEAAGIRRNIEFTTTGFALAPFLLRGTKLVGLLHRRLGEQLAEAAELRLIECPVAIPPITETMLWHPRRAEDPAHRWLRTQVMEIAAAL
jgi:DNA-binding transcriptional LysR family regulator